MHVQNAYYEVALSEANGCITRIVDKYMGQTLPSNNQDGHLWHANLHNGITLAHAVFEEYSPVGMSGLNPTLAAVKSLADGTAVGISGKVVTAAFDGSFYIEEADRSTGIKVLGDASAGSLVTIDGTINTIAGERIIIPCSLTQNGTGTVPDPLGMNNRSVLDDAKAIGLYVKTWGCVDDVAADSFTMTDGSPASLKVYGSASVGSYVTVTGALGSELVESSIVPVLRAVSVDAVSSCTVAKPLVFDDSAPGEVYVRNAYYEVAFSKINGCINRITDMSTGEIVTSGTSGGHLWYAELLNSGGVGGADYANHGFNYRWNGSEKQLELNYIAIDPSKPALDVQIIATFTDQNRFGLEAEIENRSGTRITRVDIPYALRLNGEHMQEAFFPVLPGIRFNRQFFEEHRSWNHGHYPRNTVFADYAHFGLGSGQLATYSVLKEDITPIVRRTLSYESGAYVWKHAYEIVVANGSTWKSPKVRILIGGQLTGSVEAYRRDTGLSDTPSLRNKLGNLYDKVTSSLSTKWDVFSILYEFQHNLTNKASYEALWKSLPGPSLLFICNYPRGGQDKSNPDIFPIDPQLGTDEDFRAVAELARTQNHLIMPYVNPTFWDEDSETARSLEIEDFAVLNAEGMPLREGYDGRYGYAVTPQAPAVQARLQLLMQQLAAKLPIDLIWEDQVGSRYGLDYNPHSPNPALHAQGWLEHTRRYQHLKLMAEHGHDRQVASHVGFQGNLLLYEPGGDFGDSEWGKGTWEYYPIVPMMARDKILFYNAPDHYVRSKRDFTWALAMGQMPSYDIHMSTLNTPWHKIAAKLQQHVLSKFADKRMTHYEKRAGNISESHFEEWRVIANWSDQPYNSEKHMLSPEGFLVTDKPGDTVAGVFTKYNGIDLTAGDHYLIVIRSPGGVVLYQPVGEDTPLTVDLPSVPTAQWRVRGVSGSQMIDVPSEISGGQIRFDCNRTLQNSEINYYEVYPDSE